MEASEIKGVIVPILTPLTDDERVDRGSLRRLVDYLLEHGVHGIWASGTTGEFANLSDEERLVSIETVVDQVAGRVPVIANISGTSTRLAVNLARSVRDMPLAGIAATPPYYFPSGQDELLDHFRWIRERVALPLWVYNIPSTVKTAVESGTIAQLAAEGAVVGVKDSSGAGEALAELNILCRQRGLSLYRFLGSIFRITGAGGVGAHGVIPSIANLVPGIASRGWEAGERGDDETAQACEAKLLVASSLHRIASGGSYNSNRLASMKSALKIMGVIDQDTMSMPMKALTEQDKKGIQPILEELGLTGVAVGQAGG